MSTMFAVPLESPLEIPVPQRHALTSNLARESVKERLDECLLYMKM